MKKTMILAVVMLMPLLGFGQSNCWKGFIDFYAGTSFGTDRNPAMSSFQSGYTWDKGRQGLTFGMNVTGGYQLFPYLFAGVGFGGYTSLYHYNSVYRYVNNGYTEYEDMYDDSLFHSIYLPVYADVRWTLDIHRKVTPFVDMKIGYQFAVTVSDTYEVDMEGVGGFYFMPTVGFRFGKMSAFNLGLSYNTSMRKKYKSWDGSDLMSSSKGALMLNFGAEF